MLFVSAFSCYANSSYLDFALILRSSQTNSQLDAMLSDTEEGLSNCAQIVKEMARVTNEGGAILIVSHLNGE